RSRLAHRASGPTTSYLKTRVRASRLYEAAFILAFIELTRRLHQAYEQAYDKQAAEWLLPQNSVPGQKDLQSLISQARDIIKNATGDCAKLLGKDALSRFDAISGNIQFNGDILVHVEGLGGGVREGKLSDVPPTSAV